MTKVLMVCLGNICRSPLAEGILRDKAKKNGLDIEVDSAGTSNYHVGSTPDKRSIDIANKNNIDISNLRGRQFIREDFEDFDLIYAMDKSNYRDILSLSKSEEYNSKVIMIMNELHPNEDFSVPDPYYGGNSGFQNVYNLLDEACNQIIDKIKNEF